MQRWLRRFACDHRNITASQFILDAILTALGKPITTKPTDTPSLEAILAEVDKHLDTKLDKRLGEFERRLLAEFRQNDRPENRQLPPEELIEDIPETKPDYQAVRDRVLGKLKMGRQSAAGKAMDFLIRELMRDQTGTSE